MMSTEPSAAERREPVQSYADAFYEVARMLGMNARSDTPENVWRNEMQPLLAARLASPTPAPAGQIGEGDGALRSLVASVLPIGDKRASDDKVMPFYITMGELRAIRAALGTSGAAST